MYLNIHLGQREQDHVLDRCTLGVDIDGALERERTQKLVLKAKSRISKNHFHISFNPNIMHFKSYYHKSGTFSENSLCFQLRHLSKHIKNILIRKYENVVFQPGWLSFRRKREIAQLKKQSLLFRIENKHRLLQSTVMF